MRKLLLLLFCAVVPVAALAQRYDISGKVLVKGTEKPIGQAVVELPARGLWAVADNEGHFIVKGVPAGKTAFAVSCLGFVTTVTEVDVRSRIDTLRLYAPEDNLTLESVVVTAKEAPNAMATSRTIGGTAIEHLQMINASDLSSLLPGGKTVNPNLINDNVFSLRDGGSSAGNASFGTAVEVDGVRLSTNASLGAVSGASTRNIASTNIESVEVVTGVPSAEYGDISSGMVRLKTRKGKTPYTVVLSTNPRTKQVSASKGFDLGKDNGVLNTSVEYTRATKDPVSPYTSYSRTGISLNYQNTFAQVLRFDLGVNGNIGGMDSKDDPDAEKGAWARTRDNALRVNTSLKWQLNRKWITSVDLDASLNFEDNLDRVRTHPTSGSPLQAVHAMGQGYYITDILPTDYFTTKNVDSKELDYAASLKATWVRSWGDVHSNAKMGVAWRAEGNIGEGEYYDDPRLSPNGYRPRPYTDIPYMHNLAGFIEETINIPLGSTSLQVMAGLRFEKTFIKNTEYKNTTNLSPRFNLKYRVAKWLTVRGGWGITEKLPSFNTLYPAPQYRDISSFEASYKGGAAYVYHSQPFQLLYNEDLRWQRNRNSEVGLDLKLGGTSLSLVGYFNRTRYPYELTNSFDPFSYRTSKLPEGYTLPTNPLFKVDSQTGQVFVRDGDDPEAGWNEMDLKQVNRTFVKNTRPGNSSPVDRMGLEFVFEFPRINPIRTELRLDGSYGYTKYVNTNEASYYPSTITAGNPYPYVGIYPDNGGSSVITYNGRETHRFDANLTATTHIPSIRMIISLRLEATLLQRQQNLSEFNGREYAFNVGPDGPTPTGGSVYDGDSYTAIWPIAYLDLDGNRHPFTEQQQNDPAFANLMLRAGNTYTYRLIDYSPYFSANLSITKEIGNHVSVSFYANNFTNSRKYVKPYSGGTPVIFTPDFYYGLTLRLKF